MRIPFEQGSGIREGLRDLKLSIHGLTAFITSFVFILTGAVILYANVATGANLTTRQAVSWIEGGVIPGAAATIFLCLYYKQPIIVLPSLPALLVMGPMFQIFSLREMIGGYILAGMILFFIGAFGIIGKIGKLLPIPIIMGMIAGVFMSYGIKMVDAVMTQTLVSVLTIGAFLLASLFLKKIPPLLIALAVAIAATFLLLPFKMDTSAIRLYAPVFLTPVFSPRILLSVTVPLVLLSIADTLKGYGVLRANEYEAPLNATTMVAGALSVLSAFFLSHTSSQAGPVTAIIGGSSAGEKNTRYTAAVLCALGVILIGVLAGVALPFVKALPAGVSNVVAGLAMLGLFTSSLEIAFGSKKFQVGAFTAFIVGMANVTLFGVGAPVWSILFGIVVSLFVERRDFSMSGENAEVPRNTP
jgi:benzoate membrane transport protein